MTVYSAWPAWFASPGVDPGSLVLVATAGLMTAALARALGASIGKVVMTDTRLKDGNMDPTAASSSPSEGLPTEVTSADAPHPASNSVAASLAPADRLVSSTPTSSVQATAVTKDIPQDPMVHTDNSDMVEEAIEDASLDSENSETATDRLASKDVP
ncbi:hypothetical protein V6N11_084350 [Hibiscus sabdariffa]|uniref:Uncharacterized protein n=1 Tax=Hibiscus sabdariffa TaxID=183260 RepID=A0ABR2QSK6_9ROSI